MPKLEIVLHTQGFKPLSKIPVLSAKSKVTLENIVRNGEIAGNIFSFSHCVFYHLKISSLNHICLISSANAFILWKILNLFPIRAWFSPVCYTIF